MVHRGGGFRMGVSALQETDPGQGSPATRADRPATNPSSGSAASDKEMMAARRPPSGDLPKKDEAASSGGARARRMTLRFDEFAWGTLEAAALRDGETLEALVTRAVLYYEAELPATRIAMSAPRFKPPDHGSPRDIALRVPFAPRRRLEAEAARQDVPLEQLYEHAALMYLADIDAGRVADRVLEGADEVEQDDADA